MAPHMSSLIRQTVSETFGIIGHCMGGRTAFLGAAVLPFFEVAVMLYGGHIFKTEGQGMPPPIAFTQDIRAVMLGLFGRDDHVIGMDEVKRLDDELSRNKVSPRALQIMTCLSS